MITNQVLAILRTTFRAAFTHGFTSPTPILWDQVATRVASDSAQTDYAWLGQFPELRKWIGERAIKSLAMFDYSIKNEPYESTVSIKLDDIENNKAAEKATLVTLMGAAARKHPDKLVFAALKAGDSSLCYDGQNFFDTDHPVGDTTVSNHGGGSGTGWYLLDTRQALKPLLLQVRRDYEFGYRDDKSFESVWRRREIEMGIDASLNVGFGLWQTAYMSKQTLDTTNFDAAMAAMQSIKSDEGRSMSISPNLLVVPPSLRGAAMATLKAQLIEVNGAAVTNYNQNAVDVLVVSELS